VGKLVRSSGGVPVVEPVDAPDIELGEDASLVALARALLSLAEELLAGEED
jgi:hypothetical protein